MSLRVSSHSTMANASPSVALEKGAYYRTRASHKRSTSALQPVHPYIQRRIQPRSQQNAKLVALLVLLVFACITCFGTAYYLFKSRWEGPAHHPYISLAYPPPIQANASTLDSHQPDQHTTSHEKFLAYLPHSGFHNQRIALENALVLARLLNRTLIVPPVRLGNKPIPYYPFGRLSRVLASDDKTGLKHCVKVPFRHPTPAECLDHFDYTFITWDWLVNLTQVETQQKLQRGWNFSSGWFSHTLGIPGSQILELREQTAYQYRFVDSTDKVSKEGTRYLEDILIKDLAAKGHRLLFFGTLFGSDRLRLEAQASMDIRRKIRETMTIAHPVLIQVSDSVSAALGGKYLAIHFRAGDSNFHQTSELNARKIWWTLVHRLLNKTTEDTMKLEQSIRRLKTPLNLTGIGAIPIIGPQSQYSPVNPIEWSPLDFSPSPWLPCRKIRSRISTNDLFDLNTPPLYIATDLKNPQQNPLLSLFQYTFPCTFYLSDFAKQLAPLDQLISPSDGIPLHSFLHSFVDAMVAARALQVVGTKGSTFSHHIEDVLWKRFHNLPIKQRG